MGQIEVDILTNDLTAKTTRLSNKILLMCDAEAKKKKNGENSFLRSFVRLIGMRVLYQRKTYKRLTAQIVFGEGVRMYMIECVCKSHGLPVTNR